MATLIPTSVNGVVIPGAALGPLRALFDSPFKKNTYQFPRDLSSNPARAHVILFECYEVQPVNITEEASKAIGGIGKVVNEELKKYSEGKDMSLLENLGGATAIALEGTKETLVQSRDFVSKLISQPTVGQTQIPKETIALYMPDTVNVQYSQQYDDSIKMTEKLGRAYYMGQVAASIADTVKSSKNDAENVLNRLGTDPVVRSLLAKFLSPLIGNQEDLLLRSAGYALNPQLQVFFRNTEFRRFQFDFLLTPYSKDEAEAIKNIIRSFKTYSAPEITKDTLGAGGMFFKMPYLYTIKFLYKGTPNENIHKIGTCVLTDVIVDYAPDGWATHTKGEPTQVRLSLRFQETEIIDRAKILDNY